MRIAQVATMATPVRRYNAGSVESLVWLLSQELAALGHEVSVFGAAGSEGPGEVVETLPGPYGVGGAPDDWLLCEWLNICSAVERAADFDVVHSHGYLLGAPLRRLVDTPLVHTLHVMPGPDQRLLAALAGRRAVTGLSGFQWGRYPEEAPLTVVPHGVDAATFAEGPGGDYALYLGRFLTSKGPLEAIRATREFGLPLVLAGPENDYFREHLAAEVDGTTVRYVGSVTAARRSALLGHARALVYPLSQGEPFGLVLIEAMMTGTPVAALRVGAVPEIVEDGTTGVLADSPAELPVALMKASGLDRRVVRERALARFSGRRMAEDYLRVYEAVPGELR